MKKIDKLFVKAYIGPFVLTTAIVVFIFLMRFLMMYFNDFVGKNLEMSVFAKLFFYFTLITIPTALPLATLLATLMCFGNMGEHSELTAMKSAGIPLTRLIRPTFILSIFITVLSLIYNNYLSPWANLKVWSLLYDVKTTKLAFNLQEGIFYNEIPGYRIKVDEKMPDGKSLRKVIVYDHNSASGNKNVTIADSGRMYTMNNETLLVFELFNGINYSEGNTYNTATQLTRYSFQKNRMVFPLNSFGMRRTDENEFKYHEYMKDLSQLTATIDSVGTEIKKKSQEQSKIVKSMESSFVHPRVGNVDSTVKITQGAWIDSVMKLNLKKFHDPEIHQSARSKLESMKHQLESDVAYLQGMEKTVWGADYERWNKFSTAFACLAMFLIGASLGAIIKKGGFGMPVLISIAFFILYYILQQLGSKYAKDGILTAVVGAWMPFCILFTIGVVLLFRARKL